MLANDTVNGTANGTTLQALLATVQPSALAAAYAAAAQPSALAAAYAAAAQPPAPVVVSPPVVNNATASGALNLTGANAAVAAFGNLTPQADGFSVAVNTGEENFGSNLNTPSGTTYRFFKTVNDSARVPTLVELVITRSSATNGNNITYSYGKDKSVSCKGCTVAVSTPAGATHPVTFTFTDVKLNFDLTLNGSLVGDAVGALWSVAHLPGTTLGEAAVSGVAFAPTDSILNSFGTAAKFILADGTLLELNGNTANYYGRLGVYSCFSNCGITAVPDPDGTGTTFSFDNSKLALPNFGSLDPAGRGTCRCLVHRVDAPWRPSRGRAGDAGFCRQRPNLCLQSRGDLKCSGLQRHHRQHRRLDRALQQHHGGWQRGGGRCVAHPSAQRQHGRQRALIEEVGKATVRQASGQSGPQTCHASAACLSPSPSPVPMTFPDASRWDPIKALFEAVVELPAAPSTQRSHKVTQALQHLPIIRADACQGWSCGIR
jgi:hypothetical protein